MRWLWWINERRWFLRLPLKTMSFGLLVLIVCFPNPVRFIRHVQHWRDPNALIEPDAPVLQPMVIELREKLSADLPPREVLKRVELFVHERVPYDWDWNTWGTVDYLPTVDEVISKGREDCDGRAVIAASLLRNLGFQAELVTDFAHVWVKTDKGETMGPGRTKVLVMTDKGWRFRFSGLKELPRAAAYGTAVFPLGREIIIALGLWILLTRRYGGKRNFVMTAALFGGGLMLFRMGGIDYRNPSVWLQWVGVATMAGAMTAMIIYSRRHAAATTACLSVPYEASQGDVV